MASHRLFNRIRIIGRALWFSLRRRTQPQKEHVKRVLIAQNMLLGDTILLAALMKKIRQEYPLAEYFVLCRPAYLSLLASHPYGFHPLAINLRDTALLKKLFQQPGYDLAVVPDDNRYAWLARAMGARWIVGFAQDTPHWKNWMLDQAHFYPRIPHTWSDLMATLIEGAAPEPFHQDEWPLPIALLPDSLPGRFTVLHVGAGSPLRYWPAERWRMLAQALTGLNLKIVLTAAATERKLLEQVDPTHQYMWFAGELALEQMAHLLARASLLVSSDTGIAHLARLTAVPTVVLYGPGTPELHGNGDFWRYHQEHNVWQKSFICRNQHELFRREVKWVIRCKRSYGHRLGQCSQPACMKAINLEMVLQQARSILREPRVVRIDTPEQIG